MLRALGQLRKMTTDAAARKGRILWVDCEMTGLDPTDQTLVEIATIVTDSELNIIAEGPDIVIHQSDEVLDNMNDWCKDMFPKNGLLDKIKSSKIGLKEAEKMSHKKVFVANALHDLQNTLDFLYPLLNKGEAPLAGNTVYMDRKFLSKYMPTLESYLHYRLIDVSTVKELGKRWYPTEMEKAPEKQCTHRALDDIRESIQELKYYRQSLFKEPKV